MRAINFSETRNESARRLLNMAIWSSSYVTIPLRYEGLGMDSLHPNPLLVHLVNDSE